MSPAIQEHRSPISARGLLEHLLAPADDHDGGAAARELSGRRLAEVRAPAGNEGDPSRERSVGEHPRGLHAYSPITLITSRFGAGRRTRSRRSAATGPGRADLR